MPNAFACIQCGNTLAQPYLSDCKDYYLLKPYRVTLYRCESCGLVQQSPIPENVASFYDAYPVHKNKSRLYRLMRKWVMGAAYFRAHDYLTKSNEPSLLLDFGCGDGWFLDENRAPNLTLIGFEATGNQATHVAEMLNLPIYSDEQVLLRDYEGKVDVVTMHFVLEHLTDINHAFGIVKRLLKPNGMFYFVIPNISSWEARFFGKMWHNLDAPRHICFPEIYAINQIAGRWGFDIIKKRCVPFPNGVAGSIPVMLTGRFRFSIFLAFLPLGIILSRIFPSGNAAYWLRNRP